LFELSEQGPYPPQRRSDIIQLTDYGAKRKVSFFRNTNRDRRGPPSQVLHSGFRNLNVNDLAIDKIVGRINFYAVPMFPTNPRLKVIAVSVSSQPLQHTTFQPAGRINLIRTHRTNFVKTCEYAMESLPPIESST